MKVLVKKHLRKLESKRKVLPNCLYNTENCEDCNVVETCNDNQTKITNLDVKIGNLKRYLRRNPNG
jgi:hypothetical protein